MKKTSLFLVVFLLFVILPFPVVAAEEGRTELQRTALFLDSQKTYDNMQKSYAEGYVPTVKNGVAYIVVPLLCDGKLKNDTLRASVQLGDAMSSPFVYKNYQKDVKLFGGVYLISFPLELSKDRINGNYPVSVSANGADLNGESVTFETTVYVVISDGKAATEEQKEEPVVLQPKVLVESYRFATDDETAVTAGAKFRLTALLVNKSSTESVSNMTVTVAVPNENFTLLSASDTQFIDHIGAGKTKEINFDVQSSVAVAPGQYDFNLSYDFAYNKGMTGAGSGTAKLTIGQALHMQFDPPVLPQEIIVADTVEVDMQAMNLGRVKVYNVRAQIDADGLIPQGTVFFGDIEPGSAATVSTQVTATGLTVSNSLYGKTTGTVTYYYEDAEGKEYSETQDISTVIKSPLSERTVKEDHPKQWWIIIVILAILILAIGAFLLIRYFKGRKLHEPIT